jgi:GNAT superfamily N-acetyltransferase
MATRLRTVVIMAVGYVRPARSVDADEMARIQLATWRVAYRRLPASVLEQVDEGWMVRRWREAIEQAPTTRHHVLVAIEQSQREYLVGLAASGPADEAALAPGEAPLAEGVAAVTDLLVEPRWGRRGHGSRLLSASVAYWRGDGFTSAVAWIFAADPAMRKFLTSAGWAPDGATRALDVDDLLLPQLRLHVSVEERAEPDSETGPVDD